MEKVKIQFLNNLQSKKKMRKCGTSEQPLCQHGGCFQVAIHQKMQIISSLSFSISNLFRCRLGVLREMATIRSLFNKPKVHIVHFDKHIKTLLTNV